MAQQGAKKLRSFNLSASAKKKLPIEKSMGSISIKMLWSSQQTFQA